MNDKKTDVYILYAGKDEKVKEIVKDVKAILKKKNIEPFDYQDRDEVDLPERDKRLDRIDTLIDAIGKGRLIIMHLDQYYFRSIYCLDEIVSIVDKSLNDIKERLVPIVHDSEIMKKIHDLSKHEELIEIVKNFIKKYIEEQEKILTEDDKKILDTYPIKVRLFLKELKSLRYQFVECNEYSDEKKEEIKTKVDVKTKGLYEYIKKEKRKRFLKSFGFFSAFIMILVILSLVYDTFKDVKDLKKDIGIIIEKSIDNDLPSQMLPQKLNLNTFSKEIKFELKKAENFRKSGDYNKSKEIYKTILKQKLNLTIENRIEVYRQLVNVDSGQKRWKDAKKSSVEYISFLESLEDKKYNLAIAHAYKEKGKIYFNLGKDKYKKARDSFELAKGKYQEYHKKPHEHTVWTLSWIGYIYEKDKNYKDANQTYNTSLKLLSLLDQNNSLEYIHNIPWLYSHLGYVNEVLGNHKESIKKSNLAMEGYVNIDENASKYNSNKAWIYRNLGYAYSNEKNYEKALQNYKLALKLYKRLEYTVDVAKTYYRLYKTYFNLGTKHYDEAEEALKSSLDWYKKANQKFKTDDYSINIGKTHHDLASFYEAKDINLSDEIVGSYHMAIEIKKTLEPQKYLIEVVWSQRSLANYYFERENYLKAEKIYKEALKNCQIVVNEYNQTKYAKELAWTYHDVGVSIEKQDVRIGEAIDYYEKAIDTYESNSIFGNNYALSLYALEDIYFYKADYVGLERVSQKLSEFNRKNNNLETLDQAVQLSFLALSRSFLYGDNSAVKYYKNSLQLCEKLDVDKSSQEISNVIVGNLISLGEIYSKNNSLEDLNKTVQKIRQYPLAKEFKTYIEYFENKTKGVDFNATAIVKAMNEMSSLDAFQNQLKFKFAIVRYMVKAFEFKDKQDYDTALKYFKKSLDASKKGFEKYPLLYVEDVVTATGNFSSIVRLEDAKKELFDMREKFKLLNENHIYDRYISCLYHIEASLVEVDDLGRGELLENAIEYYENESIDTTNYYTDLSVLHIELGDYYRKRSDYPNADKHFKEAFKKMKYIKNIITKNDHLYRLKYNMALVDAGQDLYGSALKNLEEALELYKKILPEDKMESLIEIQRINYLRLLFYIYLEDDRFDKLYQKFVLTHKEHSEELGFEIEEFIRGFAETYVGIDRYQKAIDLYADFVDEIKKDKKLCTPMHEKPCLINAMRYLYQLYLDAKQNDLAIQKLKELLSLYGNNGSYDNLKAGIYVDIGNAYLKENNNNAKAYYNKAIDIYGHIMSEKEKEGGKEYEIVIIKDLKKCIDNIDECKIIGN